MKRPILIMMLLGVTVFGLAARLEQWFGQWEGNRAGSANLMQVILGDARRMFATHFYVKADAYFHSGYYPSIFDQSAPQSGRNLILAGEAGYGGKDDIPDLAQPEDWIEKFGRHFFPSEHTHLDEGGAHQHHDHGEGGHQDHAPSAAGVKEILPWLRLSANLDPNRPETYTLTAFWLRKHLDAVEEAEAFLREGLNHNPDSYQILFELGRLYEGNRNDIERARNLWELALQHWAEKESGKLPEDQDLFMLAQIASHLAILEEREGDLEAALGHLTIWKQAAPNPDHIEKRIAALQKRIDRQGGEKTPGKQ